MPSVRAKGDSLHRGKRSHSVRQASFQTYGFRQQQCFALLMLCRGREPAGANAGPGIDGTVHPPACSLQRRLFPGRRRCADNAWQFLQTAGENQRPSGGCAGVDVSGVGGDKEIS